MAKRLYIQLYNSKRGESITLPINPQTIELLKEQEILTYNILDYGEVPVRGNKKLQRFTLSGFLPENTSTFSLLASLIKALDYKPYDLTETKEMIDRWIENGDVIRVIISGEINKQFLLEKYGKTIKENTTTTDYSIDFVEYRNPTDKQSILSENLPKSNLVKLKERYVDKYIPAQITGQAGQTIYKIAQLNYGGKWQELRDRNGLTDANMDLAGQIVEMLPI